jgi:hypothetical protein
MTPWFPAHAASDSDSDVALQASVSSIFSSQRRVCRFDMDHANWPITHRGVTRGASRLRMKDFLQHTRIQRKARRTPRKLFASRAAQPPQLTQMMPPPSTVMPYDTQLASSRPVPIGWSDSVSRDHVDALRVVRSSIFRQDTLRTADFRFSLQRILTRLNRSVGSSNMPLLGVAHGAAVAVELDRSRIRYAIFLR